MCLHARQDAVRDVPFQIRLQQRQQMPVSLPRGHVQRPFAARILQRPPRTQVDQALHQFHRRATMRSLMQRCIARRSVRARRVHEVAVSFQNRDHAGPVVAPAGTRQVLAFTVAGIAECCGAHEPIPLQYIF